VTVKTRLADLIDIDNSAPAGQAQPRGFQVLKQAATDLDELIQEARQLGKRVRALGSGWALSDIAITDGWLVNTKMLNGAFEITDRYFDARYDPEKRPFVVLAQAGMSIGELNVYLETQPQNGVRRALQTSGIGAGQTVAGAVSGSTHGSGIKFGSTPDFVVGIHLVTGTGTSCWIERASKPVMNDGFVAALGAQPIRDDDVFNAAVVSFGCFGIIAAVAIETSPIYHLKFAPVRDVGHDDLKRRLRELASADFSNPEVPYHYEFVFNPYDENQVAMEASARKVAYEPHLEEPGSVWVVRNEKGFALGNRVGEILLSTPLMSSKMKAAIQFKEYRRGAILDDVRGTPGQVFTATIFYFEGYTESALAVSIDDAPAMLDISSEVARRLDQPCISQVRLVHPTDSLLGFTLHGPKTAVFEFGLVDDERFPVFEKSLTTELRRANIHYTFHWSKNSGIDNESLMHMYGAERVRKWREARDRVFNADPDLKRVFDNPALERTGLAGSELVVSADSSVTPP
jgi:FAD/FMN-containing dehydrogenase